MRWRFFVAGIVVLGSSYCVVMALFSADVVAAQLRALPDNPCDVLTREQVSTTTGLEITAARRAPAIGAAEPGTLCVYQTISEFGAITIVVPSAPDRTTARYLEARANYFRPLGSVRTIPGLGTDAWMSGGNSLYVLARPDQYFIVQTQMYGQRSGDLLIALARAVLDRF